MDKKKKKGGFSYITTPSKHLSKKKIPPATEQITQDINPTLFKENFMLFFAPKTHPKHIFVKTVQNNNFLDTVSY